MSERLPVHLDPATLADRGREVAGTVPVAAFRRLGEWLDSDEGELAVELRFGRDDHRRRVVTGQVRGRLMLECQRCLCAYALELELPLAAVLVDSESEANTLPDDVDAIVIGPSMHAVDMIEDDLILALPLVPKCGEGSGCTAAVELLDSERLQQAESASQRPFAGLGEGDDPDAPESSGAADGDN